MSDLKQIEDKLDKLSDTVSKIEIYGAVNNQILKEHQKRSDMNEKAVEILTAEFKPIRDHVIATQGLTKWIKILLGSGILVEIARYFK